MTVLDVKGERRRLAANIDAYPAQARIPVAMIHQSAKPHLSPAELAWTANLLTQVRDGPYGALMYGPRDAQDQVHGRGRGGAAQLRGRAGADPRGQETHLR